MTDEFNHSELTNDKPTSNDCYIEVSRFEEQPSVSEIPVYEEIPKPKAKKQSNPLTKILSSLTAAVAAVVSVVVIAPAVVNTDKTQVEFAEVWSTDTAIGYSIRLEDRTEDPLQIVVYNDFTERTAPLEGNSASGEVTGLKSNMTYKLAVRNGNKVIAETSLRTKKPEELPVTVFRSVTHECTCNLDGYFHFQMDFIDQNNYWSDFRATLTDENGTVSVCEFAGAYTDEQTIEVIDAGLLGSTAVFRITCKSSQEGNEVVLYEKTVQI